MTDECPMTEECPGFDRDARVCHLRPDDCEFAAGRAQGTPGFDTSRPPTPDAPLPTGTNQG